jgi:restriction system protein
MTLLIEKSPFVATSGTFKPDAQAFAEGRNVILVDGPILFDMILRVRVSPTSNARVSPTSNARVSADGVAAFSAHGQLGDVVHCPVCKSPMVKRTAKHGANAGGEFWGCSRYPACKGVRG